jgi:periplasmic protein TonB
MSRILRLQPVPVWLLASVSLHGAVLAAALKPSASGPAETTPTALVSVEVEGVLSDSKPPRVAERERETVSSRQPVPVPAARSRPAPIEPPQSAGGTPTAAAVGPMVVAAVDGRPEPFGGAPAQTLGSASSQGENAVTAGQVVAASFRQSPGPGSAGSLGAARDLRGYAAVVSRAVGARHRYPSTARRQGIEGMVRIRVRIASNGSLAAQPVVERSAHPLLDAEATRMVLASAPFPRPPGDGLSPIALSIPVRFALDE